RDISREHELRFRVIREQKFRTLGSLAAGVAHNINNRLTPVLGWTEMLQERLSADEAIAGDELKHALTVIHQGASDSVETVRRLQEYSRPARVKGPEAVQLRDVLEQLLALTRPQWDNEAARRGIRYEIDLKADPAPAVLAVASEVREALLNSLENALAAMPQGAGAAVPAEARAAGDRRGGGGARGSRRAARHAQQGRPHRVHGGLRPRGARPLRARARRSRADRPRHAGDDRPCAGRRAEAAPHDSRAAADRLGGRAGRGQRAVGRLDRTQAVHARAPVRRAGAHAARSRPARLSGATSATPPSSSPPYRRAWCRR